MEFYERLKLLRDNKNISRDELAKKLNLSYSAISKYETNVRFPDKETLQKLADFFDVSVDFLLGRTDIRNPYVAESQTGYTLNISGLPEEAVKQAEEYIEFLKQKYKAKENSK